MSADRIRLRETREEADRRIEKSMEARLVLFCEECKEMTRYTGDSLTWYCSECGGGDLSTEKVREEVSRDV